MLLLPYAYCASSFCIRYVVLCCGVEKDEHLPRLWRGAAVRCGADGTRCVPMPPCAHTVHLFGVCFCFAAFLEQQLIAAAAYLLRVANMPLTTYLPAVCARLTYAPSHLLPIPRCIRARFVAHARNNKAFIPRTPPPAARRHISFNNTLLPAIPSPYNICLHHRRRVVLCRLFPFYNTIAFSATFARCPSRKSGIRHAGEEKAFG